MQNITMANMQKRILYQTGLLEAIGLNQFFYTEQKTYFCIIGSFRTSELIFSFLRIYSLLLENFQWET